MSDIRDNVAQLFRGAVGHHQAGRLDVAERGYRAVLAEDPLHVASLHHLGIIALQAGRTRDAIELIGRAAGLKPELPDQQYNLGVALQGVGRLDEAAACYRNAISLKPNYAAAYMNLGNLLLQQGRLSEAIVSCWRSNRARRSPTTTSPTCWCGRSDGPTRKRLTGWRSTASRTSPRRTTISAMRSKTRGGLRRRRRPTGGLWRSSRTMPRCTTTSASSPRCTAQTARP